MVLTKKAVSQYFSDVTTSKANAALKNLRGTRKFFSDPEKWGKGDFEINEIEDEKTGECIKLKAPMYCLIGGTEYIDGPGEKIADRLLIYAVGNPYETYDGDVDSFDDFDTRNDSTAVTSFNDNEKTKHKDIIKLLDRSIKFAETLAKLAPKKLPKVKVA